MSHPNKTVVRQYLADFVTGGDLGAAETLVDPAVVFSSPYSAQPLHGREDFVRMILGMRAAFPDLRIDESAMIAEGRLVAARWTASGTHTGTEFGGAPASGLSFTISGMSFYEVTAGRITAGWVNDDNLGMLTQLGLLPASQTV